MSDQELDQIYSDEVQEVLGHIPNWIIRWGIAIISITFLVLLSSSWFVQYPEIISGSITITSHTPPIKVVTRSTGRLQILIEDGDEVKEGEVLGYVKNSSDYDDMMAMEHVISQISLGMEEDSLISQFMVVRQLRNLALGEIQPYFETLQQNIYSLQLFYDLDVHGEQIGRLQEKIVTYETLNRNLKAQMILFSQELEVSKSIFLSDSTLRAQEHISKRDYDNSKLNMIQRQRSLKDAEIAMLNNRAVVSESESRIRELSLEQRRQEAQFLGNVEEAIKNLKSQIDGWKHTYLLLSPLTGSVSFFEFLTDSRFVQSGQTLMTVIPDHPDMFGIVHIPVSGSGRVNAMQSINISLENYPSAEYGTVLGVVERISTLPREDTYSVHVSLPKGLLTSYGHTLDFRQQMQGKADIITEDLRLLERVFYQFRNIIDQAA